MKIIFLGFIIILSTKTTYACLDQEKIKAAFDQNQNGQISKAIEIRTTFLPEACGLDDLEVLTRPQWDITPGTTAFPAYLQDISTFIANSASKVPVPLKLTNYRAAIHGLAIRIADVDDQIEFRESLLDSAARDCEDLVLLTSVGAVKGSWELKHRLRRFYRENAALFGCGPS